MEYSLVPRNAEVGHLCAKACELATHSTSSLIHWAGEKAANKPANYQEYRGSISVTGETELMFVSKILGNDCLVASVALRAKFICQYSATRLDGNGNNAVYPYPELPSHTE